MNIKSFIATVLVTLSLLFAPAANADPIDGRHSAVFLIKAHDVRYHDVFVIPETHTTFAVAGDGDGDIDCRLVKVSTGEVLARDIRTIDGCVLHMYSPSGGLYRLVVTNAGVEDSLATLAVE